jgi:uncharacterized protein (DUF1330 family)
MEKRSVEAVVAAFGAHGCRYLIAGGLAVVAHGYVRTTRDIDIVLALDRDNALRAVAALTALGYRPMVPVAIEGLADAGERRRWMEEKNAVVLRLHSEAHRKTPIDIFIGEPFDFDRAHGEAHRDEVAPGLQAAFVGFDDLIRMKRAAGRPQDLADIHQLSKIRERLDEEET